MTTVTVKITGDNECLGKIILYDKDLNELGRKSNVRSATFNLTQGVLYHAHLTVQGSDGEKYKIVVEDAQNAVYPTSEITMTGSRDDFWIKINA